MMDSADAGKKQTFGKHLGYQAMSRRAYRDAYCDFALPSGCPVAFRFAMFTLAISNTRPVIPNSSQSGVS